ncbi:hypothetical protein IFM89_021412 [Coptis chinensis]|uniref:Maintenance of Photosystem II under High light 2 C-terminal domain-containing protein n=1 Tax=Coptis chinensis TaxID=261450 RepID=A0A835IEK0_9MAGN|nr:hypothetical protein IFM89_021412 [Coptis chinensis]
MVKSFLSTANTILPLQSSSPSSTTSILYPHTCGNVKRHNSLTVTNGIATTESSRLIICPIITKRNLITNFTTIVTLSLAGKGFFEAEAAILEAEDDIKLLEKVEDKKKMIERQAVVSSSTTETAYLQELVYKLSKVGQALQENKLSIANSVLGPSTKADWIQKVNKAFSKLSSSPEEKIEVDTFNSSLTTLISSVTRNDIKSSKIAFVSSVVALEKWTTLSGLVGQLNGL